MTAPFVKNSPFFEAKINPPTTMDRDAWQTDLELGPPGSAVEAAQPRSNFDYETTTSAIVSGGDKPSARQEGQMIGDGLWRRSGPNDLSLLVSSHNRIVTDSQATGERESRFEDEPRLDSEYGMSLLQAQIRALQNSPPFSASSFQADPVSAIRKTYFWHSQGPHPALQQSLPLTTLFTADPFTASFEKHLGVQRKETVSSQHLPEASLRPSTLTVTHDRGNTSLPPIKQLEAWLAEESIPFAMPYVPLSPSSVLLPELVPDIPLSILESDHGPHGRPTMESLSYTSISIADELAREAGVEASMKLESAMKASRNAIDISKQAEAKLRAALDIFGLKQKPGQSDPHRQLGLLPLSPIQGQSLSTKVPPNCTSEEDCTAGTGLRLYLKREETQYSANADHEMTSVQSNYSSAVNTASGSERKSRTSKRTVNATGDLNKDRRSAIRLEDVPDPFGHDFLNQFVQPSTFAGTPQNKQKRPLGGLPGTSCWARDLRTDQQQLPAMTAATPLLDPAIAAQVQSKTDAIFRQSMQVCQKSAEEDQQANEAIRRFILAFRQADHLRQVSTSTSTSFYSLAPFSVSSSPSI